MMAVSWHPVMMIASPVMMAVSRYHDDGSSSALMAVSWCPAMMPGSQ